MRGAAPIELIDIPLPGADAPMPMREPHAALAFGLAATLVESDPPAPAPAPSPVRIETVEALEAALDELGKRPMRKLGEALVEAGRVTRAQIAAALEVQARQPTRQFGEILVGMGVVTTSQVKTVLAVKLGIPTVDAKRFPATDEARAKVAAAACARHCMLPLILRGNDLVVAMDNPLSAEGLQAARFAANCRIVPVLANAEDIRDALRQRGAMALDLWRDPALGSMPDPRPFQSDAAFGGESLEFNLAGVEELATRLTQELVRRDAPADEADTVPDTDSTLVKLVNKMILDAHQSGASDIHVEPDAERNLLRVRMRRDGVLTDYAELPARFRAAMISRIKIMANLDIAERRRPQDGKIDFSRFSTTRLELRVATVPTQGQESVVLRLLSASRPKPLESLGLGERVLDRLKGLVERPHGLILVCGPTGSGKTTTLHSLISSINSRERKIWTVEDPVEITQAGLCQVQVNLKIDLTFAAAMRSFLRADPDVIMVGEMRDAETAATGVEASLTGHLVLSTLHTNSAADTVSRMLDLGVDPFNFADCLMGVMAQRLARKVCDCAVHRLAAPPELDALAAEYTAGTAEDAAALAREWLAGAARFAHPAGCAACGHSGYRGRLGLFEFMEVTPAIAELVRHRAAVPKLRAQAMAEGMRTLKQDGILKVIAGLTTMAQVRAAAAA